MTYPKASTTGATSVPSSPRFPEIEEKVLDYWEQDGTFQASVDAAGRGRGRRQRVRLLRRPAVRQRAAALRPPADRLRQGRGPALPDDARAPGRAPVRLGHPRPARRARGDAAQRHQDHRRDPRAGHREVQRGLPRLGDEVHRRVARLRHPPGALGRLRPRLPDLRARLHGVGDLGVQAALRQGLRLRGLPGPALLLERRDPAVQPRAADGRRRLPDAPGPRGHRRLPADERTGRGRAGPRLDDDAVDAADATSRSMVGADIDYVVVESDATGTARALPARRGRGWRRTRASSATSRRSWRGSPARTWSAAPTRRRSPTTSATSSAFRVVRGRVRHHHGRHRAGAHRRRVR